jgi:hypothetical protein
MRWVLKGGVAAGWILLLGVVALGQGRTSKRGDAKGQVDWEPVPGYKYRSIDGFNLLVNKTVLEEDQKSTSRRKPMQVLELELDLLVGELPPRAVVVLRDIPIWVEWDKTIEVDSNAPRGGRAVAQYHPGNTRLHHYSYTSLESKVKSNAVEIVSMKLLTAEHQGERHRSVLLHEITHAVHHHLFDFDNPHIKAAYQNAMSKGLYAGEYASTNEREYFAEVSCAYFGHLDYAPHNTEELKRYDAVGYQMMELTWGTPEVIAAAIRVEMDKQAMPKLAHARRLLANKKKHADAVAALEAIVKTYPGTKAAADAKKVLDADAKKILDKTNASAAKQHPPAADEK